MEHRCNNCGNVFATLNELIRHIINATCKENK
jgi:predicted  nucleic acid-binding Zn-ribbon protein